MFFLTLYVGFAKTAPEGGGTPWARGGKSKFWNDFGGKFRPILEDIWMDFDLNLGSDFALMLAPTRDA